MPSSANDLRFFIPIESLSRESFKRLAKEITVGHLEKKSILFKRGDNDRTAIFLLSGTVLLIGQDDIKQEVIAESQQARYALAGLKPRQFTGVCKTAVSIATVNSDFLDKLISWDQVTMDSIDGIEVTELESDTNRSWMRHLLNTKAFLHLPTANIEQMFKCIEEIAAYSGDVIVKQGDPGDYYYIIQYGKCRVSRVTESGKEVVLADLDKGDCFGEEALISEQPRNATVTMLSDGILMRLARSDFNRLLKAPMVAALSPDQAIQLVREEGAVLIDTRYESEYKNSGRIKGSINMPLYLLRLKSTKLDPAKKYILYCDTGQRSSAAAFLLNERGFETFVLDGGLSVLKQS